MQGQPIGVPQPGSAPQAYAGASAGEPRLPSPTEVKLHSLQQHAEQLQGMRPHLGRPLVSCSTPSVSPAGLAEDALRGSRSWGCVVTSQVVLQGLMRARGVPWSNAAWGMLCTRTWSSSCAPFCGPLPWR